MTRVCPRPCGKLATATVFIIIGVVQFLVGIILLRSKYANLLSGPDFMTASSNIGFGCVYGILSSIWKTNKKRKSEKQVARRNVLASLLVSIIAVNATTSVILIMGDGNALLVRYLDQGSREFVSAPAAFAHEVLACAYVTSVCSPIVCIVVAIVTISTSCFSVYHEEITEDSLKKLALKERTSSRVEIESTSTESQTSSDDSVFMEQNGSVSENGKRAVQSIGSTPLGVWQSNRNSIMHAVFRKRPFLNGYIPSVYDNPYDESIQRVHEAFAKTHRQEMLESRHGSNDTQFTYSIGSEKDTETVDVKALRSGNKVVRLSMDDCAINVGKDSSKQKRYAPQESKRRTSNSTSEDNFGRMHTKELLEELGQRVKQNLSVANNVEANEADTSDSTIDHLRRTTTPRKSYPGVSEILTEGQHQTSGRRQLVSETSTTSFRSAPYPSPYVLKTLKRGSLDQRSKETINYDKDYNDCSIKENPSNNKRTELLIQKLREKNKASMDSITEDPFLEEVEENSVTSGSSSHGSGKESSLKTILRKASVTSNNMLKKMLSTPTLDPKVDVSDLIVDKDSLIGLSEEELMARTNRIRSLSKVIAQRLQTEAPAGEGSDGCEF